MEHHFVVDVAIEYGTDKAILLYNICFWIATNKQNGTNQHDGRTWTYNSARAFAMQFPYWGQDKIRKMLKSLEDDGILISGNYNLARYDRTKWYALKNEDSMLPYFLIHSAKRPNGSGQTSEPIPDRKPDRKPDRENGAARLVMGEESKSLYNKIKATFETVYGEFPNYGKEGKSIKGIIAKASKRRDIGTTEEVVDAMVSRFRDLRENGDKFWKGQPFLPSALNADGTWARVFTKLLDEKKKAVSAKNRIANDSKIIDEVHRWAEEKAANDGDVELTSMFETIIKGKKTVANSGQI